MTQKPNEPKIGDEMPDGTNYLGLSDTGKPTYARLGEQMPDGSIYVGISSIGGKPVFARLGDQEPDRTINAAVARAAAGSLYKPEDLSRDARLLHKLYLNWKARQTQSTAQVGDAEGPSALKNQVPLFPPIGCTFNETMKYAKELAAHGHQDRQLPTAGELKALFNNRSAAWYWSSLRHAVQPGSASEQLFSDGLKTFDSEKNTGAVAVRLIRQETDADQQKPQTPTTPKR